MTFAVVYIHAISLLETKLFPCVSYILPSIFSTQCFIARMVNCYRYADL